MGELLNNLSVAEAMGDLYGRAVQVIIAISGILGRLGYLAIQWEHLGGRLTVMLLERIGRGIEVHEMHENTLLQAIALLQQWDNATTEDNS